MRHLTSRALAAALAFACGAATRPAAAQAAPPADTTPIPITIGLQTSLRSSRLGEQRPVLIHLPVSYAQSRTGVYPVLYLLDGEDHFAAVSAVVDFLARNGRAPEMIVVGVPNTTDRTHDLTPPADTGVTRLAVPGGDTVSQSFPTAGGAAKLRAFLTDELAPWVQARYRTAPYRILVGHSFGGLFVVDALAADPRAFNAYVAISPTLWWEGGTYVKRVEAALRRAPLDGRALYMTTGEREGGAIIDPARELASALDARHAAGFRSWYRVIPAETHNSTPLRTEYDALERIFEGWEPSDRVMNAAFLRGDVAGLEAHHAAVTARFGIPSPLTSAEVNRMAYANLQQKKLDVALRLFRRNVVAAPEYANGWNSLADGLEAQRKPAEALEAQERAVQLGEAQHDPLLPQFRSHRDRLRNTPPR